MINKPINPAPFNKCVDMSKDWNIKYEIPNNKKISGRFIAVNDINTGKRIYNDYANYTIPTSNVKNDMSTKLSQYNNGEYSWHSYYWSSPHGVGESYAISNPSLFETKNEKTDEQEILLQSKNSILDFIVKGNCICSDYTVVTESMCNENYGFDEYLGCPIFVVIDSAGGNTSDNMLFDAKGGSIYKYGGISWNKPMTSTSFTYIDGGAHKTPNFDGVIDLRDGERFIRVYKLTTKELIAEAKVLNLLASNLIYDHIGIGSCFLLDNENFHTQLKNNLSIITDNGDAKVYEDTYIELCRVPEYPDEHIEKGMLLRIGNNYHRINNVSQDYATIVTIEPSLSTTNSNINFGDEVIVFNDKTILSNISPYYYFRGKSTPQFRILTPFDDKNLIEDMKGNFGISYTGGIALNYFQLYLSVLNQNGEWEAVEKSHMIFNKDETYEFKGFANDKTYKIYAVCIDDDGDEWTTDEVIFKAKFSLKTQANNMKIYFNNETCTINICTEWINKIYRNAYCEFYRQKLGADILEYAGAGLYKTGGEIGSDENPSVVANGSLNYKEFVDYNIQNKKTYNYFARVKYIGLNFNSNGEEVNDLDEANIIIDGIAPSEHDLIWCGEITTDFEGTSIIGLVKRSNAEYEITRKFTLTYYFDNNMSDIVQELSREYIGSFTKYQKELKGSHNFINGSARGLLGSEKDGKYVEPEVLREEWLKFINDDSLKLYRGFNGETGIISINSSRIKPYYYNDELVNEAEISFKQIGSVCSIAIYENIFR